MICIFRPGDATGGHHKNLGITESSQACAELVVNSEPSSNGVTIDEHAGKHICYAQFDATSIGSTIFCDTCRTCIFGMFIKFA